MAEFLFTAALWLISASMIIGLIRLVIGSTMVDRVIALDLLTLVSLAVLVVVAHFSGRFIYLDVALVNGLLSFLGVLAVARYLEKGL